MKTDTLPTEEELLELGFRTAAYELKNHKDAAPKELRVKLRTAFEHYRVVEPEHIDRFNKVLKAKTLKVRTYGSRYSKTRIETYQTLNFTPIHNYTAAPPRDVLISLREAKLLGCFDSFEIATIKIVSDQYVTQIRLPDPILFGRINGSDNRYFIAQWDDDVKIEDILREDEG